MFPILFITIFKEVFSPDHFYIQLQENEVDLDEFLRDLTEFYIRCEDQQEPTLDSMRLAPSEVSATTTRQTLSACSLEAFSSISYVFRCHSY